MTKETFVLWARYNQAVNVKIEAILKTLSKEEWNKDLGGFFKSVRGIFSHIYIFDFNWLKRLSGLREFDLFKDEYFNRDTYSYSDILFEDLNEYLAKRPFLDEKMLTLFNELKDSDMEAKLKFTSPNGNVQERVVNGLMMSGFNHDTFHRGTASLYLELLGRENDFAGFGVVL